MSAREVMMPRYSISMEDAVLTRWHVRPGDTIRTGAALAEIEADKVTVDLESPCDGTVARLVVDEGDVCEVGQVLCVTEEAG